MIVSFVAMKVQNMNTKIVSLGAIAVAGTGWFKRIFSTFLIIIFFTIFFDFTLPKSASASFHFDFPTPKQFDSILSDKQFIENTKKLPSQLKKVLSNKQLVADAKKFLNATPEMVCKAYLDSLYDRDNSKWEAIGAGVEATATIAGSIVSASTAGAGSLAGYAGMASAVSQLGLGSLTTAIAGMMGSSVSGAAATAVVTSAVGGPIVMGTLIVGGTGAAAFGIYELGKFSVQKLGIWAESSCVSQQGIISASTLSQ